VVKGEGKAKGKVAGRVKVKPNGLPDYPVITSNSIKKVKPNGLLDYPVIRGN
jgi:hypothetical protein